MDEEIDGNKEGTAEWDEAWSDLSDLRDKLGINEQGWRRCSKILSTERKESVMQAEASERDETWNVWPFKDDDHTSPWEPQFGESSQRKEEKE